MTVEYLDAKRIQGSSTSPPYTLPTSATDQEIDVSSQLGDPSSLDVSSDGIYLFGISSGGTNDDTVVRWKMTTAWDLSTASQDQTYSIAVQSTSAKGIRFNGDGTRMFISSRYAGSSGDNNYVYQYNLSEGFDLTSTITQPEEADISTLVGSTVNVSSLNFNTDGTKMFVSNYGDSEVWEFTVGTGFDLSSTVTFVDSFDFTGSTGESYSVAFMNEGKSLIITDKANDKLVSCPLTTAYDISTGSATPEATLDVSSVNGDPMGASVSGAYFFTFDGNGKDVCRFNAATIDEKATLITAGTNSDWTNGTGWTFGSNKHTVNNSTASVTRLTYYDLGANQPDGWVLRFVLQATALASGGGWKFDIGLTEDATSSNMENENPTGTDTVYARVDTGDWACLSTNGSSTLNYDQFNSYSLPYTIPSYYVEVRKLSSSQAQVKIWSDDWDGTLVSNSDVVSLSANPVCRYIFARFYYPSGATADNTVNVSNLKYYNSTTTSGTPTFETDFAVPFSNLPENTLFEETDTRSMYFLQDSTWKASHIGRGLFGGAYSSDGKAIKYITVATTGTVTDFGNLTNARGLGYACGSREVGRGLFAGGYGGTNGDGSGSDVNWQNIDYVNIHSAGNASDFGDLNVAKRGGAGFGSQTRAIFGGGYT